MASDTNFIYNILSTSECQQRNNEEHFKTNKTPNEITVCLQTNCWVTWLKLLGSKFFFIPKDESSLIKLDSFVSAAVPCKQVSTSLTAETTAALPNNVHRLTQQACCCEPARAAAGRRQLNGTPAQWCVGMFSKRHGYGTDRQTDRWTNGHMDGV